jgi:hypothetical protein
VRVLEFVGIVVAAGAPWIVGIVYYWRRRPRDDWTPPSFGETLRQRMRVR